MLSLVVIFLAGTAVLMHSWLIQGGRWGADEYCDFCSYRINGISWLYMRLFSWSQRPASEALLYLYYLAFEHWSSPLIVPFLGALWVLLIGCAIASLRPAATVNGAQRLAIGLAVLSMFLLGHRIVEMFFGPWMAAPYMLALTGMNIVAFRLMLGDTEAPRDRAICCAGLCLAVTSSETGMFFAMGFCSALVVLETWFAIGLKARYPAFAAWYLAPLALSVLLLAVALATRVGGAAIGLTSTAHTFHHLWPSVMAAAGDLPKRLAGTHGLASEKAASVGFLVKALLLVGFAGVCRAAMTRAIPWHHAIALGSGLTATIFLTSLAAYYQYGFGGFERHDTFQQCAVVLLLLLAGRVIGSRLPIKPAIAGTVGMVGVIVAISVGLGVRLSGLVSDYRLLPEIQQAQQETWTSGIDASVTTMRFVLPPPGAVLTAMPFSTGHFDNSFPPKSSDPFYMYCLLGFFGKSSIDLVAYSRAGQTP